MLTGADPGARYLRVEDVRSAQVAGVEVASFGARDASFPTDEVVRVFEDRRGIYRKLIVRDGKLAGRCSSAARSAPTLVQMYRPRRAASSQPARRPRDRKC